MDNFDLEITYGHMSVEFILKRFTTGNIIINDNPKWDLEKQQSYIESLFFEQDTMYPLVLTSEDQILHVRDGCQRLNAIIKFVSGKFACNDSFYEDLSKYDKSTFMSCMLYCETIMEPTESQIVEICESLSLRDIDMVRFQKYKRIVFRDSNLYHPDTVKFAKTKLIEMCPHADTTPHYVEIDLEHGENVDICDLCGKGL